MENHIFLYFSFSLENQSANIWLSLIFSCLDEEKKKIFSTKPGDFSAFNRVVKYFLSSYDDANEEVNPDVDESVSYKVPEFRKHL